MKGPRAKDAGDAGASRKGKGIESPLRPPRDVAMPAPGF